MVGFARWQRLWFIGTTGDAVMTGRSRLADRLRGLEALRRSADSEEAHSRLAEALAERSNQLVAAAARMAAELALEALEPDLAQAFSYFMVKPLQRDPSCTAKTAIVKALVSWQAPQHDLYLEGIDHIQMEPVYGGREDTAGPLRAQCALGLARSHYDGVLVRLADLLADPVLDARLGAVQAIAEAGVPGVVPLLRYKTRLGDEDARVQLACFEGLLALAPEDSVSLVTQFLDHKQMAVAEAAALALGQSRQARALEPLMAAWQSGGDPALRRTVLMSLAMLRHEQGLAFLLDLLADGEAHEAHDALEALALFRHDEAIWSRVERVSRERNDLA